MEPLALRMEADGSGAVSLRWTDVERALIEALAAITESVVSQRTEILDVRLFDHEGREVYLRGDNSVVVGFRVLPG